jgi:Zn-dependent protease with chaperone function
MNPLAGVRGGMTNLFSTHPATAERIKRLDAIALQLRGGSPVGS